MIKVSASRQGIQLNTEERQAKLKTKEVVLVADEVPFWEGLKTEKKIKHEEARQKIKKASPHQFQLLSPKSSETCSPQL